MPRSSISSSALIATPKGDRAGLTKQALGQLVDHLQAHGYVQSVASPTDGRVRIVLRTPLGEQAKRASDAAIAAVEQGWVEQIGARRYAEFRATLRHLGRA